MKELPGHGDRYSSWIAQTAGSIAAERVAQVQTPEERREQIRKARLEIYGIGHKLIKRLLDESRPLPTSAEELAFEEEFGAMSPEQIVLVNSMLEQIQEACELVQSDYADMKTAVAHVNVELEEAYFAAMFKVLPKGPVSVTPNQLGYILLELQDVQSLDYYLESHEFLKKQVDEQEIKAIYAAWGDKYPVIIGEDNKTPVTVGNFKAARRNRITGRYVPTLLVSKHRELEETKTHEIGHHLNELLSIAIEEHNEINEKDDYLYEDDPEVPIYEAANDVLSLAKPSSTPTIAELEISLAIFTHECFLYVQDEITSDLLATGNLDHLDTIQSPGWYDYFIDVFGDIRNFNGTTKSALIAARNDYYDRLIPLCETIKTVYANLQQEGELDKIDAFFGMMRAKPIHLWAREIRRTFSAPPQEETMNSHG